MVKRRPLCRNANHRSRSPTLLNDQMASKYRGKSAILRIKGMKLRRDRRNAELRVALIRTPMNTDALIDEVPGCIDA
ncbi:hypothetical protein KCP69_12915 [Salmonella enterica subsp. enterica]|nr:hypothetical protein KCP69_12915 [Salmonella enterica subsp. enterica]